MGRSMALALLAAAVCGPVVRAQPASPSLPAPDAAPAAAAFAEGAIPGTASGRLYGDAEYLVWWMRGAALPPLVTASPPGTPISQAGLLGSPGTIPVFGQSTVNDDARSGMRFTLGGWVDRDGTLGIEGNFLLLEAKAAPFAASSNGSPILGRPFINATTGQADAERVAFPGDVSGSIDASATGAGLIGAGLLLRDNLFCYNGFCLDLLGGYRFLRLADRLAVVEDLTSTNPRNPNFILAGTQIDVADTFGAKNEFNGFDMGFEARYDGGPWSANLLTKIAVGWNRQAVDIGGATTVIVPGTPPSSSPGGVLALSTNIGHHSRDEVSVIPELDFKVGYQLTPRLKATVGYTLLYWSDVARAGDQIDLQVNPGLLPNAGAAATGPQRPLFEFQRTYFWTQGISLGMEFRY
jgi:hypothetical protein